MSKHQKFPAFQIWLRYKYQISKTSNNEFAARLEVDLDAKCIKILDWVFFICISTTVHFIFVCQKLFGDSFFISCFFELKLSLCVSTFLLYNQEQTFSLIRQKTKIFPIDPHYEIRQFMYRHIYRHDIAKVGDF